MGRRKAAGLRIVVSCPGKLPERLYGDGVFLRSDDPVIRKLGCSADVM